MPMPTPTAPSIRLAQPLALALALALGPACGGGSPGTSPPPPALRHAISGTISGAASAAVAVHLGGAATATTSTGPGGAYTFADLADGSYTVTPALAGYTFAPTSQPVTLAGADASGRDFTATPVAAATHSITGTVTGAVPSVTLTWSGSVSGTAIKPGGGAYSITGLPSGTYTLTPTATGYTFTPPSRLVVVGAADVAGIDFAATPAVVALDRWETVAPTPAANHLPCAFALAPDDVWVGLGAGMNQGDMLHWTGAGWTRVATGATTPITGVWAGSPSDVWAVSDGAIAPRPSGGAIHHWDGTAWSSTPLASAASFPTARGIWGAGPGDVWVFGGASTGAILRRWTGSAWAPVSTGVALLEINAVHGRAANDLWAVGVDPAGAGRVIHWNGTAWSESVTGIDTTGLSAVWVSGPDDVWVAGRGPDPVTFNQRGSLLHWDGTAWARAGGSEAFDLRGLWGAAPDDLRAVGRSAAGGPYAVTLHWNGTAWAEVPNATSGEVHSPGELGLLAVTGTATADVWAVGQNGRILRWDGTTWTLASSGPRADHLALWVGSASDAWATATGAVHPQGVGFNTGRTRLLRHWDGTAWSDQPDPGTTDLFRLWGTGPSDVWGVGNRRIAHFDGTAWSDVSTAFAYSLNGVWGTGAADVWAVGHSGSGPGILHWNGSAWSQQAGVPGTLIQVLRAVWASGPSDAWAVGSSGLALHWNGTAWSQVATGTTDELTAVWGSGPADVWAATSGNGFRHWDGAAWSPVPLPGSLGGITHLWGRGPSDVWAVGAMILHWNGSAWAEEAYAGSQGLTAVGGSGPQTLAVGLGGAVLRRKP